MTTAQDQELSDGLIAQAPLARAGLAEEVAASVASLASDDASFVTGVQLMATVASPSSEHLPTN